jgi:hypothetical protein
MWSAYTIDKFLRKIKYTAGSILAGYTIKWEDEMGEDSLIFRFVQSLKKMRKMSQYRTEKKLRCLVVNRVENPLHVLDHSCTSKRTRILAAGIN